MTTDRRPESPTVSSVIQRPRIETLRYSYGVLCGPGRGFVRSNVPFHQTSDCAAGYLLCLSATRYCELKRVVDSVGFILFLSLWLPTSSSTIAFIVSGEYSVENSRLILTTLDSCRDCQPILKPSLGCLPCDCLRRVSLPHYQYFLVNCAQASTGIVLTMPTRLKISLNIKSQLQIVRNL